MRKTGIIIALATLFISPLVMAEQNMPRTGITEDLSGVAGDDGEIQAGMPHPIPSFIDNGDGTVRDNLTGLIWLKNVNCGGDMSWTDALDWAVSVSDGECGLSDGSGAGDWRLPNIRELVSLMNFKYRQPALSNANGSAQWSEGNPFNNGQFLQSTALYWTSTSAFADNFAHTVNIARGITATYDKVNPVNDIGIAVEIYSWPVKDCSSIGGGGCD
ncbi:Lcl C-terminal domain-containing protein [Desulfopila inferna]|uniref:Lcl C-terminal domain-containing protein n=1 Tax=Desulfopila inferna TaxID=468528 RepID=UPI00196232EE|nr:DUF1566 domain-containing protein [Desulfopila inferna]MBM9605735.1 DUF1566 domain-containing protein [Desulfopila inferna]